MHILFILTLSLAFPYAYAGGKNVPAELEDLAGKKTGAITQKDLSRFYDGSKMTGDSDGSLKGLRPADISGGDTILPEAPLPSLDTTKYPVPPILSAPEPGGAAAGKGSDTAIKGGDGRSLTAAEIAVLRKIYGDKIDYSKVRIVSGDDMTLWGKSLTRGTYGVTWGNTIYFPNDGNKKSLYSQDSDTDWLVHEMAHVYQYQKDGWGYFPMAMWEQLTQGTGAYEYHIEPGKEFGKYGIEHQATIIQDYYRGALSGSSTREVERMLRAEGLLDGLAGG